MSYHHLSKPTQSGDAVECMVLVYYELLLHREKRWFDSDLTDKPRYRLKNWQRGDIDESLCGRKTRQKVRIFNFRLISPYTQTGGHWSKISGAIWTSETPNIGGPSLPQSTANAEIPCSSSCCTRRCCEASLLGPGDETWLGKSPSWRHDWGFQWKPAKVEQRRFPWHLAWLDLCFPHGAVSIQTWKIHPCCAVSIQTWKIHPCCIDMFPWTYRVQVQVPKNHLPVHQLQKHLLRLQQAVQQIHQASTSLEPGMSHGQNTAFLTGYIWLRKNLPLSVSSYE